LGKFIIMTSREKFIAIVDNDSICKSDVIVLLEGDGLNRCNKAADLYKNGWADKIVFSGGICDYSYGSFPIVDVMPHLIDLGVPPSAIILENKSLNTKEQAEFVIELVQKNNWKKLILVATHDHQYRAYLTFLKKVLEVNPSILMFNAPARNLPWFKETGWGTRFNRLQDEFKRIELYGAKGHLASFEDVLKYQEWKESQI
jgi:uncharacterized SAM-binding protein YcdF (DUF218 family)